MIDFNSFERAVKLPDGYSGGKKHIIYWKNSVLMDEKMHHLQFLQAGEHSLDCIVEELIGYDEQNAYYFCEVTEPGELEERFLDLRHAYRAIDEWEFTLGAAALGLLHWRRNNRFCGKCGSETMHKGNDRALICDNCGHMMFPKISPAVIIAVKKGDSVLLAHNYKFREGLYGMIAGFLECGETPEEAVVRELREEVGIEVENIQYVKSQAWPFPDSLMLGYTADYKSGEMKPDGKEILDAGWFNPDNMPAEIPGPKAIAGQLFRMVTGWDG